MKEKFAFFPHIFLLHSPPFSHRPSSHFGLKLRYLVDKVNLKQKDQLAAKKKGEKKVYK